MRRLLLACGIASSVVYVVANIVGSLAWPAYRSASQTISELSAVDAPSRPVWLPFAFAYAGLLVAFGVGVWRSSMTRRLRVTAVALIVIGALGPFWPPMHQRGVPASMTDVGHIAFTVVTTILIFIAIASGTSALGGKFRLFTLATLAVLVVSGGLTFLQAPAVGANAPTPWLGVFERIDLGAYLLWVAVLSATLLRVARPVRGDFAISAPLDDKAMGHGRA
ncbi:MAG: DUF998 domain-containing protein [Deltaproteobacteria bacterium]|nr:DUF998 domain-containing protein [Deltaproteobacteria bacterium]